MKRYIYFISLALFFGFTSCEQEWPVVPPPDKPEPPDPGEPSAGTADFSKFVVLGNSLTAGFQSNALFDLGQMNSLGNIMAGQFSEVGGGEFVQPDINTENGFNPPPFSDLSDPNPANWVVAGRLILAGDPPLPTPTVSDLGAVPVPPVNPGFIYSGPPVNNFSVPGVRLEQALSPQTGDWALLGTGDPLFNPFYARFASIPGSSNMAGDAAAAEGSFFLVWLGSNDVLLYAVNGAYDAPDEPPLTSEADFAIRYNALLSIMTEDEDIQGVVGNIPDITSLPYFKLVPWNSIVFEEGNPLIDFINNSDEVIGYNTAMAGAASFGLISQEEAALRTIQFAAGSNGILVEDESLTPLVGLPPPFPPFLPSVRLATERDLIGLTAGFVLGMEDPNDPTSVTGITAPLADRFTLLADELELVQNRTDAFNTIISNTITAVGVEDRVALADINQAYKDLVADSPTSINGVAVTPSIVPPTGIFSEDGVHPNSRGYALTANYFIEAINEKFGANVHQANIGQYPGNGLPQ